ncbi:MAG TPA: S8 family serine peptidase [Armatimonadota bacterium]
MSTFKAFAAGFALAAFCAASPAAGVIPLPGADHHKLIVQDPELAAQLSSRGASTLVDYGAFRLMSASSAQIGALPPGPGAEVRDDLDTILLNAGAVRTQGATAAAQVTPPPAAGKRLGLVQFAGPVLPEWRTALDGAGVRVVCYVPNNAYLVFGDAASLAAAASCSPYIQWASDFRSDWKLDRRLTRLRGAKGKNASRRVTVQLVEDDETNASTMSALASASAPIVRKALGYVNVVVTLSDKSIRVVAARPDVVSIQPYAEPHKMDERQARISSGFLTGAAPSGPGYLNWLTSVGFTQAQFTASGFVVDVTDSGIDNGTAAPYHPNLRVAGAAAGASRVSYARLEGTANSNSTLKGCDGHGTLNAHIIGGYNAATASPHVDSAGYHYGLGIAPFVKLGSSVIFDPDSYTNPDVSKLQSEAYAGGARVSSNSWGGDNGGAYDSFCQEYDSLVRDAQSSVAGNQQMVIVFSAGNAGPGLRTMGTPGAGKNIISVGATENVQAMGGADASGIGDTEANSANDMVSFSSRGPCADGRVKPDIVAPGTHVSGGVAQAATQAATGTADACFSASGVSGGAGGSKYFPLGQQYYTASSGTSHSCPAVAGGAALVRQWFINKGLPPASPAMTKALLMNSARYLTGAYAGDTLPSTVQGWGAMNLGDAFAAGALVLRDQQSADIFTATGQTRVVTGVIASTTKPAHITLAWTDAPGSTTAAAYNNDLDLQVLIGGKTYQGNVFSNSVSTTGGRADVRNNVESVFLPAGVSGNVAIIVTAKNIVSDGVPGSGSSLDQDFALAASNITEQAVPVIVAGTAAVTVESCSPGNSAVDPNETVTVSFGLRNVGTAAATGVTAALVQQTGVIPVSGTQTVGSIAIGATAAVSIRFTATGNPGDTISPTLTLQSGAAAMGSVSYPLRLGALGPAADVFYTRALTQAPDSGGTISQTITVSDEGAVDALKVAVRADHPWATDATIRLIGPDGTTAVLSADAGYPGAGFGSGANDESGAFCIFDDSAAQSVQTTEAPFVGAVRPVDPLSVFAGKPIAGPWTLVMEDSGGNSGVALYAWRLDIAKRDYRSCTVATPGDAAPNGAVLVAEGCGGGNGVIDPAELVTVNLGLRNIGASALHNVVATLQPTGGVIPVTVSQAYGDIGSDTAAAAKPFQLYVKGDCWGVNVITLHLTVNGVDSSDVTYAIHRGKLGSAVQAVYADTGTPLLIPDDSLLTRTIAVPDIGVISNLKVRLRANHTYVSDLYIILTSPDGTDVILDASAGDNGQNLGSGANTCAGTVTVFDDAAATSIHSGTAPFAGSYQPTQKLASLIGKQAGGVWTLRVYDTYPDDTGTLGCWSLDVTAQPTACCGPAIAMGTPRITAEGCSPANGAVDPNETVTIAVPLKNTGNTATANLSANLLPTGGVAPLTSNVSYGVIAAGATVEKSIRLTANALCGGSIVASLHLTDGLADLGTVTKAYDLGALGTAASNTYTYAGSVTPIPDLTTTNSVLTVAAPQVIKSIVAKVRINHTYVSDLSIVLRAPTGQEILLFGNEGADGVNIGTGTNSCAGVYTTFDDAATTAIAAGTAPFSGSYQPEEPLAGLKGVHAEGVWTLAVTDSANSDTGTLGCWALVINGTPLVCCGGGPTTMVDAINALRLASGLTSAGDRTRLNVETAGTSAVTVDIRDAVRLAKTAAGL